MGKKRIATKSGSAGATYPGAQVKRGSKKSIPKGIITIHASFNNTIMALTDLKGQVAASASAGTLGYKGTKKSTPYVATLVARNLLEKATLFGLQDATVVVKGIGPGREGAIRGLANASISISSIIDNTPQPHNGVKA